MLSIFQKDNTKVEYNGYLLWILVAIELFMSFSFLGYIHIKPHVISHEEYRAGKRKVRYAKARTGLFYKFCALKKN